MEIETLGGINGGMFPSLSLLLLKVIALLTIFLSLAGFAVYLAGLALLFFNETRHKKQTCFQARANTGKGDHYEFTIHPTNCRQRGLHRAVRG